MHYISYKVQVLGGLEKKKVSVPNHVSLHLPNYGRHPTAPRSTEHTTEWINNGGLL